MTDGNVLVVAKYSADVGYAWGFIQRFWLKIAEGCGARGSHCYVAYPSIEGIPEVIANSPLVPLECDFFDRSPAGVKRTLAVVRDQRITAIYLTDADFRDPFYARLRRAGVKRLVNHDHTPGDRPPLTGAAKILKSMANRIGPITCDLWVALSPMMRDRALHTTCVPAHRCVVVQNGIDPESPGAGKRDEARERLGLEPDQIAVVILGRAIMYKGIDFSILVAAEARRQGLDKLVFLHFGDGPHLDRLKGLASDSELPADYFQFLGRVENAAALLEGCDIALHPARGEGFSLAILEYMRAELPVLLPDRPSVYQSIEDGRSGLVYISEDVESALRHLVSLMENPADRKRLGSAAAKDMRAQFTWSRTLSDFERVSEFILDGTPVSGDLA